jgi:hypothetical protein
MTDATKCAHGSLQGEKERKVYLLPCPSKTALNTSYSWLSQANCGELNFIIENFLTNAQS